jgi:hypothetical protein
MLIFVEDPMKKFLSLLAFALSFSAFAGEVKVSFTHFGNNGGNQSYYACYYVEGQAYKYLELFGATEVVVRCNGGIGPWSVSPVSVRASFNLPLLSGRELADTVKLKGDNWTPSCGINVQMIREFLKVFSNISVVKKSDSCAFANSNFFYELSIVR